MDKQNLHGHNEIVSCVISGSNGGNLVFGQLLPSSPQLAEAKTIVINEFGREFINEQMDPTSLAPGLTTQAFVVTQSSFVVAYVAYKTVFNNSTFPDAILHTLVVSPSYRNRKIGHFAVTSLCNLLANSKTIGFVKLGAKFTPQFQPKLIKFYEHLGFVLMSEDEDFVSCGTVSKTIERSQLESLSALFASKSTSTSVNDEKSTIWMKKRLLNRCLPQIVITEEMFETAKRRAAQQNIDSSYSFCLHKKINFEQVSGARRSAQSRRFVLRCGSLRSRLLLGSRRSRLWLASLTVVARFAQLTHPFFLSARRSNSAPPAESPP